MNKFAIALFIFMLIACDKNQVAESNLSIENTESTVSAPDHNYSLKEGSEYGYEQAVSDAEIQQGHGASTLIMFKYAGQKDGKHQAYSKDGGVTTVLECASPCEFIKIMVFAKGIGHVKTERMRATEGTIGWLVISDALNGKLDPFIGDENGRKFTVWFDEMKSVQFDYLK